VGGGNFFWGGGGGGARPRAPKSGKRNKVLVPKTSVLQKIKIKIKKSSPDLKRFLVPKMAQDTGLRGAKISPGEQLPPTSRAYDNIYFYRLLLLLCTKYYRIFFSSKNIIHYFSTIFRFLGL